MVPRNPIESLSSVLLRVLIDTPSSRTAPLDTLIFLANAFSSALFPAPLAPTTAVIDPAEKPRSRFLITDSAEYPALSACAANFDSESYTSQSLELEFHVTTNSARIC
jgi:hypothetical protein